MYYENLNQMLVQIKRNNNKKGPQLCAQPKIQGGKKRYIKTDS